MHEDDLRAYFRAEVERETLLFAGEAAQLRRDLERRRSGTRPREERKLRVGEILLAGAAAVMVVGLGLSQPVTAEEEQSLRREQLVLKVSEARRDLETGIHGLRSAIAERVWEFRSQ